MRKKTTMTMTKIPSRKGCGTYGHGPLKSCLGKEKDDDHDQDSLKKYFLHIWSWSSDKSFSSYSAVYSAIKQRGRENKGPPDISTKSF